MNGQPPRIWLLLGSRRGDNNQVLALGEALGLPFETRTLSYRPMWGVLLKLFPTGLAHLRSASRRWLKPPWPDLVIGIGRRSVPVARWIRNRSEGRTKLVRLGHPRASNDLFDLVITTRQYPVAPADNVVVLPLALNRFRKPPKPTAEEQRYLGALPRPHLLLSLGGTAPMWQLDLAALRRAAATLTRRAEAAGGTLLVVGSPRTPDAAWSCVREVTSGSGSAALVASEVRYPVLLGDADEQFVTADSVSMISEAVLTGKPVGLIPVEPDSRGLRHFEGRDPSTTVVRDPRRFWADVEARGLVGTVDDPKRGEVEDPVETAVAAVKRRLGSPFE
jgi:mitochondrial fission protein ELM1